MANGQGTGLRVEDFAEQARQSIPQLRWMADDDVIRYFEDNYPDQLANIKFTDFSIKPESRVHKPHGVTTPFIQQWREFGARLPQDIEGAKLALKASGRATDEDLAQTLKYKQAFEAQKEPSTDPRGGYTRARRLPHVSREYQNFISTNSQEDIKQKFEPLIQETKRLNQIDYDNYTKIREETDKLIAEDPDIQAVRKWYEENPVGWGEYFTDWRNFSYGLGKFSTSFGTIAASGFSGGAVLGTLGAVGGAAVAGPPGAAAGWSAGWTVGSTLTGVGAGFTLEAGNNFDTALREAEDLGLPPDQAIAAAADASFVYGVISGGLEAIVPLSVLKKYGLPHFINSKMGKDLVEAGMEGVEDVTTTVGKNLFRQNVAKRLHKFSQAKAAWLGDHKNIALMEGAISTIMKVGKEVIVPSKDKLKTAVAEMMTEASQYLAEEMVLEGYIHPDQIENKAAWIWEKLNSEEMRESIQVAAFSYFLPGAGGGRSKADASEIVTGVESEAVTVTDESTDETVTVTDNTYNGTFNPKEPSSKAAPSEELTPSRKLEIERAIENGEPLAPTADHITDEELEYAIEVSGARKSSSERKAEHKKVKEQLHTMFPDISSESQSTIINSIETIFDERVDEIGQKYETEAEELDAEMEREIAPAKDVLKDEGIEPTPENVTELEENEVFVFGSNKKGVHGKGAAKTAKDKFGAVEGQGEGLQGQSYALPTKSTPGKKLSLKEIKENIRTFLEFANKEENQDKTFILTKIGTGLAGHSVSDIAGVFGELNKEGVEFPFNVRYPTEFQEALKFDIEWSDPVSKENYRDEKITDIYKRRQTEILSLLENQRIWLEEIDNIFQYGEQGEAVKDEKLSAIESKIKNLSNPATVPVSNKSAGEQILDTVEEHGAQAIIAIENMEDIPQEGDWEAGRKRTLIQAIGREMESSDSKGYFNIEKNEQGMYVEESVLGALKAWMIQDGKTERTETTVGDFGESRESRTLEFSVRPSAETLENLNKDPSVFNVIDMELHLSKQMENREDLSEVDDASPHVMPADVGSPSVSISQAEYEDAMQQHDLAAWNEAADAEKGKKQEQEGKDSQYDAILDAYNNKGEDSVRETVEKTNATQMNRLIKRMGLEKVLEDAGATKIKSGAFGATKNNKALLASLLITKVSEDVAGEATWEGNPSEQAEDHGEFAPDLSLEYNIEDPILEGYDEGVSDIVSWSTPREEVEEKLPKKIHDKTFSEMTREEKEDAMAPDFSFDLPFEKELAEEEQEALQKSRYFIYKYGGRTKGEVSKNIKELEAKHGKGFAYDRDIGVEGESRKEVRAKFKKQLDSMPKGSTVIVDDTHGIGRLMQEEINYAKKLGLNIQYETSLEKPVTPAGIKTKNFRTMTERKKEAAVQGDKSAQAEWAVEEVSEFYSAVEGGNISEIREEAMGLLRLAQHWPDNADVRLTVRKVIKDINKVFPTKESFNEAFDKWKAAKVKKGQAKEGVYVEDLKKTLEEIGQETPEERLRNLQIKIHPAIIEERQKQFDEWYARQEKATFKNLQVMAKEHEIPDYKKMNREQLLEALKNIPPVELLEEMFDLGEEGDARLDKIIKAWEAKHPDQGELFSAEILAEGEILQPFLKDEKKLAELLEKRLERHFGEGKLGIIAHKFAGVIKRDGIEYVGKAIGNLVAWSEDKARIDDIPHEYFHVYAEIFAETPLMKYAFKKFTDSGLSEAEAVEQLTELVGNYYAGRIQEKGVINNLKAFFRQMWLSIKKAFGKASQEDLAAIIGERFFQGWVPTTAFLTPTKIPHYSTFNNTNDGNDDSVDDDGNQIEIDAIEALKENADAFLESIFLDVFAIYIPKSEYANVIQLANDSYDQEEFDLALRTHMVDNFGDEIAEGRGVTRAKVNSENVLLVGLPPNDVKGIQKRMRKYDLYSRQLFQRVKSSTPLGAYTVEEVDADGKKTYKTVLLDQMGRVVYDTYFVQKKGRIDGAPAIRLQRQNSVATGTTNPTSFRESFMERDFKEGKIDQRFGYMPMKNIYKYIVSGPNDEWNSFWVQDPSALKLSESWVYNINNLLAGSFGQNTKGDLAVFFSTKSGDNKISILAFAQRAWKGSQQAKYKGKTVNTTKIRRTFLEEELKAQVEMGWMSEKHMEDLISNAVLQAGKRKEGWKNPYAFAQELARHIAWQSTKGNDYLARQAADGVADTVNRLRLDFSEGTAVVGSGSRKVVWADHKDIEIKVEGRDGLVDVEIEKRPEVGEGYSQDGFMYVAASKLNQRGELLGVKPEHRAVSKTVIRNLEDGGNSYIAIKMLEMSADNGTMFFKKGSDIPFAKLKGTGRKAIFIMLDETGTEIEGSEFDSFATRNEVKDVSGRYTRDFTHGVDGIHELPEDATRVLIQPYKSNTTAPHPVLVHDMLMTNDLASFPEGVEYLDALEKHIKETGKRYMDLLMNFRTNPQVLRDYLKTELADGQMPTELDAYLDLFDDGWGVMLPQVSNQLSHMLANQFLINGLFKLRTDKMRGTKTFIKPRGHREVEPMSALISSQNSMMIERVGRDYRKEQGIGLGEAVPWDDLHSKVKVLNEWLEEREYNVLISRQPVSGPTVVEPRRVQAFYEGFQGDTIRLSEYDVFVLLDADNDGDITFIEVPEDKGLIDAMGNLSKTDYWKNRRKRKPLTIYKRSTRESSLSNGKAVGDYYSRNNMAEIATGMIVNAKVVMATMAAKELSLSANILPKGERIIARDPRDIIRMDYIPLSEDMTEQEYNTIIENGDNVVTKIEDKDGKVEWRAVPFKYLKDVAKQGRDLIHETTLENEMEILLSMATDNPKEQLLGEFEMDWNFLPSRMFKTLSGQPMRSKVLRGLRLGVSNTFKNAATRRGERQTRRGMKGLTMEDIFEESGKLRTLYFDLDGNVRPAKEVQKLLTEEFDLNTPQLKFWMGHQLGNMYLQWQDIRVNNHVSAVEHILSLPQLLMDLNPLIENESVAGSPLRYERWMYDDAHIKAVKDLNALVESKINTYMKSKEKAVEVGAGSLLMEEMAAEFEELLERADTSMKNVEGIKYEYNTEFQEFIAKWLPRWNELSPRAQAWATLKFLSGTAKKNKKGRKTKVAFRHKLLPIQLMSPKIVKSYGRLFHKHLVGPIKEKKHVRPSDAAYDFQFKHFEKIAERVCG